MHCLFFIVQYPLTERADLFWSISTKSGKQKDSLFLSNIEQWKEVAFTHYFTTLSYEDCVSNGIESNFWGMREDNEVR